MAEKQPYLGFFYKSAVFIAFLCLIASSGYLFLYLVKSPPPGDIAADTMTAFNAERRMTLISTAFFIAMAFGFLGFALFLLDAKGELEGEGNIGEYKFRIAKASPGIVAMICATVIIVSCARFRIDYKTEEVDYGENGKTATTADRKRDSTLKDTSKHVDVSGLVRHKKNPKSSK